MHALIKHAFSPRFLLFIIKSFARLFVLSDHADHPAPASISSLVYLPKSPLRSFDYSPKRKKTHRCDVVAMVLSSVSAAVPVHPFLTYLRQQR